MKNNIYETKQKQFCYNTIAVAYCLIFCVEFPLIVSDEHRCVSENSL